MLLLLERYVWKSIFLSIMVTWLSLVMLDGFFAFMAELGDTNSNTGYGALEALLYICYTIPRRLYDYFPSATLIGALMGLGNLAANSELIAMRAAGLSIGRIIWMSLKLGLVLALFAFFLGEWVAPRSEMMAQQFKLRMLEQQLAGDAKGIWIKNANSLIYINEMLSEQQLQGITIYTVDEEAGRLQSIQRAKHAQLVGRQWTLNEVKTQRFVDQRIEFTQDNTLVINDFVPSKMLTVAALAPNQLAANELAEFIQHQQKNNLDTTQFELAYWTHFTIPLSALVMLIIAAPFVFGSQRSSGAGQRVFIGILLGIVFFLVNRMMANLGLVYGLAPLLSATLPLLIFLAIGLLLLRRLH